ncbi:uncharacterized protein LOC143230394 [Tachypleus tridentatus]|uniref:uncharacterized protein LOC143230394 n=1 Tax=Tachypleus tridentatus TaxID=6853 RepID=UPI003FD19741
MTSYWIVVCVPKDNVPHRNADYTLTGDSSGHLNTKCKYSLVGALEQTLKEFNIKDVDWTSSESDKVYQVYFPCQSGRYTDELLEKLRSYEIFQKDGSSIGVMSCSVFYRNQSDSPDNKEWDSLHILSTFKAMQHQFLETVTARLTVAQIVESIRGNAGLSFNFITFISPSSIMASIGLAEESSTIVLASSLISPFMKSLLAVTFGMWIEDTHLRNMGIINECIALSTCVLWGFLFGFISGNLTDKWATEGWPTEAMTSKSEWRSLWVGLLTALPTGAGVALSLLAGHSRGLIGVAIAAALLGPSVNAGLLWGYATLASINGGTQSSNFIYTFHYYDRLDYECVFLGFMSLCLTAVNIVCIIFAAICVLKIKEVNSRLNVQQIRRFWTEDVKIAREYNRRSFIKLDANEVLKEWVVFTAMVIDVKI